MRDAAERAQQQERQEQSRGNARGRPVKLACGECERQSRHGEKGDDEGELYISADEAIDLAPARDKPPNGAPCEYQGRDRAFPRPEPFGVSVDGPCRYQTRGGSQRCADEFAVQQRSSVRRRVTEQLNRSTAEGNACRDLQQKTEDPCGQ